MEETTTATITAEATPTTTAAETTTESKYACHGRWLYGKRHFCHPGCSPLGGLWWGTDLIWRERIILSFQLHSALRSYTVSFGLWMTRDYMDQHIGVSLKPAMLAIVTLRAISVVQEGALENKIVLKREAYNMLGSQPQEQKSTTYDFNIYWLEV